MPKILFTRPSRRIHRAVAAVFICALALALLWLAAMRAVVPVSPAAEPSSAFTPCCAAVSRVPLQFAAAQSQPIASKPRSDAVVPSSVAALFEQAVQLQFCEARSRDPGSAMNDSGAAYEADPTGALAMEQDRAHKRADELCRTIGPADYARIDALLTEASRHGRHDAELQLLQRRIDVASQRALAGAVPSNDQSDNDREAPLNPAYLAEDMALARQVEALAASGSRAAVEEWARLLDSGVLLPRDEHMAAAWRLAAMMSTSDSSNAEALLAKIGVTERWSAEEIGEVIARGLAIRAVLPSTD